LLTDEIKVFTRQDIDVKKKLLSDSVSVTQEVIRRLEYERNTREADILNVRQSVTQRVIQLKQAIDNCEQQLKNCEQKLKQDLDNYYIVNVSNLEAKVDDKKVVFANMRKLELFMQELKDKGSECDLV